MGIVTIIGSGMMGSALAFPAAENGHEVRLVGSPLDHEVIDICKKTNRHPKFDTDFPANVSYYYVEQMEEAIKGADMIIGGVSSFGVDWFGDVVLPAVPESTPVLTVTKGLMNTEDGRLLTYPELWEKRLSEKGLKRSLSAIGGPCISFELVWHDYTEVAFCGKDMKTLEFLKSMMATEYYHISLTTDVTGIESAVALKNGYALGIALTIGLNEKKYGNDKLHYNSQAALFGQSVKEMARLLKYQGADDLNDLCIGAGDLYVTVYGGRTRQIGILLGEGYDIDEAVEKMNGVTLESLVVADRVAKAVTKASEKGLLNREDFPVLFHIDAIMNEKKNAAIPWESFTYVQE